MNRYKKEEKRKHDEARKGLSEDEILALDLEDEIHRQIESLAKAIHVEKFPEEYDLMYDSRVDANERSKGINPMALEYIEKISNKRSKLGVVQLGENGMPVSDDTYRLCLEEAKTKIYSDISLKRPPARTCVFCSKPLKDVGGKRLIAQQLRGVTLTNKKRGGGNKDFPHQCFELFSDPLVYMDCWGEKEKWTDSAILSAKKSYLSGKQPWFCQICGERKCSDCGSPINYPVGSDILYGNGCSAHAPIFPIDPGCSNPNCKKYKVWSNDS
jgi:hypothetical protein